MLYRVNFEGFYLLEAESADDAIRLVDSEDEMGRFHKATAFQRPREASEMEKAAFSLIYDGEEM